MPLGPRIGGKSARPESCLLLSPQSGQSCGTGPTPTPRVSLLDQARANLLFVFALNATWVPGTRWDPGCGLTRSPRGPGCSSGCTPSTGRPLQAVGDLRPPVGRRPQPWVPKAALPAALVSGARTSLALPDATFLSEICFYLLRANPGLSALSPDGCKCKCALI